MAMKRYFMLLLLCSYYTINGQVTSDEKISIEFSDATALEVIETIEKQTEYRFFFIESWLSTERISGSYNDVKITELLEALFGKSVINYYISEDKKIVLTNNVLIRDSLPLGFFDYIDQNNTTEDNFAPVFYSDKDESDGSIETIRIGKEKKGSGNKKYTLSGYARNTSTKKPIENLAIVVQDKNVYAVTNAQGFYTIELPIGANVIEAKALGFENLEKRVVIYSDGTYNFMLKEDAETLEEVIVEADADRNIKDAITGVTQIKVEQIKNIPLILGERDILKVATTFPGINKAGEGSAGYNVRGGKEDQNLILLDNGVIYNPSHFFGIFSALNPFTTGNVDIYKGDIPAEFGGRLSSVFDINTKTGNYEKFSGEASVGPVTSNLTLETPVVKGKSSFLIGGRSTYSNWILRSLDDESLRKSKASFYDIVAKYNHQINDKNTIETTGYYSDDEFSISSDSTFSYSNRLISFKWNHEFNSKNTASLIFANSEYKFNIEYDSDRDTNFDLKYRVNETELKFKMNYKPNDKHTFDYGLSGKLYQVNPGSIFPRGSESIIESLTVPKERALESAVFLSDNFTVNEKLLLNIGLRYSFYASLGKGTQRVYPDNAPRNEDTLIETREFDTNEVMETYSGPEFRFSSRYFLNPTLSVKAGINSTYQYIHTLSNNTTVSPTDTWKLSDLNIEPQRAIQYSLGFYKNTEDNLYEFSLEGYYKRSKNVLDYKVGADLLLNEFIETEVLQGDGKAYGVEFLMKKQKGRLNGWLGYSYSRSFVKLDSEFNEERVNNGMYFPANYDKPHDLSLVANYKLTKRFSFSANFSYQTGRPVTYPVGNFIFGGEERVLYSDRNKFRIPDYYRLDIGFNIEGNHKIKKFAHSFWNISIYNVLGRNNPYSVFFVTENNEVKAYESSIFSIPVPTITYNFKF